MFSKESKKSTSQKVTERNKIGKNTSITGDINSDGDFRIDGALEGNLKTDGRVVIGTEGSIKGTVICTNADIEGTFSGDLTVSNLLTIKSSATISGNVILGKLSVEPGALFNATCTMEGAVKELNKKHEQKELAEKTA